MDQIREALKAYGLDQVTSIVENTSGLINRTWKIVTSSADYILQKINVGIFNHPPDIAYNTRLIADYLKKHFPKYYFVSPIPATNGQDLILLEDQGYYRLFPFVKGSHSKNVIENASQTFQASQQFGRFTNRLANFDVNQLKITIPTFHDLHFRYDQFLYAVSHGNKSRIAETRALISKLEENAVIAEQFVELKTNSAFKWRVTHHDTKISNVLFNARDEGICIIDLDTVMPGYFLSDVGDMMRTYLSPVSEEESDFRKIHIRTDIYAAIVRGYYKEMKEILTEVEVGHFVYAGKFMIYMQALRFLTDHLNNDVYYGARYPGHNFVRAANQVVLLQKLIEKENLLRDLI